MKKKTSAAQERATEKYKQKMKDTGMVSVKVVVPAEHREDLLGVAMVMRDKAWLRL